VKQRQVHSIVHLLIDERLYSSFKKLYQIIYPRAVTEFSYRYGDRLKAHIFMSFEVSNRQQEIPEIFSKLEEVGMRGMDLSSDEVAKAHARYLVGGRSKVTRRF
jgi:threonine dehydratase